jgi:hypothetical protein
VIRRRLARWLHRLAYRLSPPRAVPFFIGTDAFAPSPSQRDALARAALERLRAAGIIKDFN